MSIRAGTRFGAYEIVAPAGSGGMGEVYKATDTRLNRTVAIKLLPQGLPLNPELRSRFQREAQMVAALNHPHICTLYDVGQQEGTDYLVMEYLDGETLADRLSRGPLPLDQALEYASQISGALEKAHSQGIVHRDLKPGNVMLTKAGAKVLDFGLAKLSQRVSIESSPHSDVPTGNARVPLTAEGAILGTLHYMSPEQLEGKDADSRSDIFAFGAVLYEMITGRRAFDGQSQASLIAAIMEREPAREALIERSAPLALDRTIRKCLAKDPAKRWQSAGDLRDQILWVKDHPTEAPAQPVSANRGREYAAWGVIALLLVTVAMLGYRVTAVVEPDSPMVRFPIDEPDGAPFGTVGPSPFPAVSFDGRQIAFNAGGKLWIRNMDSMQSRPLTGTEGASLPFWSPDGRYLGFFQNRKLLKLDLTGGSPQTICAVPGTPGAEGVNAGDGASWSPDGNSILFAAAGSEIFLVPAGGGEPKPVTKLSPTESNSNPSHKWPAFLPDGKHFIYLARPGSVFLASLDGGEPVEILKADSKVVFMPPGYLLFMRDQTLMAQQFDASQKALIGNATPIAEDVGINKVNGRAAFSTSWNGVLAFRTGGTASQRELIWYDRNGKEKGKAGEAADYRGISLSPDGTRLAAHIHDDAAKGGMIWMLDLVRGGASRFSFKPHSADPNWSPDGKQIVFDMSLNNSAQWQLYYKSADGTREEEVLIETDSSKDVQGWSPDGKYILFDQVVATGRDLWIVPFSGDRKPFVFANSEFNELMGQISHDGRWVAYQSDETGRFEVYIQPFDRSGGKWPVSTGGGTQPIWNRNGKELFFFEQATGNLMSAAITVSGHALRVDVPKLLFRARPADISGPRWGYGVAPDGRFLINSRPQIDTSRSVPLTVVLNWTKLLKD